MGIGRVAVGTRYRPTTPLLLVENCFSLNFKLIKWNFTTVAPL